MMRLQIGSTIQCEDGAAGKLKYVVLDPDDGEVTHLIVQRGKLLRHNIVVPVAWVKQESDGKILLNASARELADLPKFQEVNFTAPDPSYRPLSGHRVEDTRFWVNPYHPIQGKPRISRRVRLGIQEDEVLLRRGVPVVTCDGQTAGTVDHLIVDPSSRRVTHLVIRRSWLWNRKTHILPLERVFSVSEVKVRLTMTLEELDRAPLYEAPASDEQIAFALQRALETDPRTRDAGLSVEVQDGVVRFLGAMTDAVRKAAREIAWRTRGVIGFEEDLAVPAFPPLRIGASVHARDGEYGSLHKVVVDPHARRVTHMVLHKGGLLQVDRVLPIERIERIDLDRIYLNGKAEELDQYPAYQEDVFVKPLEDWTELEPYRRADTLFWGGPYVGVAPAVLPVVEFVIPAGVPPHETVLRRDADVIYQEQLVGSLDHVLFERRSGTITHLVVKVHESGRRIFVPAEWIGELAGTAIVLKQWHPDRPGVPVYEAARTDAEISSDLQQQFSASGLSDVQAKVDRGAVRLEGNVQTAADKAKAQEIVRGTPGVLTVENRLSAGEEAQKVAAIRTGDRSALSAALERELDSLYRFVARELRYYVSLGHLHAGDLAPEEIVEEVAMQALKQARRIPHRSTFKGWLRHLALHTLHQQVKRLRLQQQWEARSLQDSVLSGQKWGIWYQPDDVLTWEDVLPAPTPSPEEILVLNETRENLEKALNALPYDQRMTFILRAIDGLSYAEIAAILNQRRDAVQSVYRQAREALRQHFNGRFHPVQAVQLLQTIPTPVGEESTRKGV